MNKPRLEPEVEGGGEGLPDGGRAVRSQGFTPSRMRGGVEVGAGREVIAGGYGRSPTQSLHGQVWPELDMVLGSA